MPRDDSFERAIAGASMMNEAKRIEEGRTTESDMAPRVIRREGPITAIEVLSMRGPLAEGLAADFRSLEDFFRAMRLDEKGLDQLRELIDQMGGYKEISLPETNRLADRIASAALDVRDELRQSYRNNRGSANIIEQVRLATDRIKGRCWEFTGAYS